MPHRRKSATHENAKDNRRREIQREYHARKVKKEKCMEQSVTVLREQCNGLSVCANLLRQAVLTSNTSLGVARIRTVEQLACVLRQNSDFSAQLSKSFLYSNFGPECVLIRNSERLNISMYQLYKNVSQVQTSNIILESVHLDSERGVVTALWNARVPITKDLVAAHFPAMLEDQEFMERILGKEYVAKATHRFFFKRDRVVSVTMESGSIRAWMELLENLNMVHRLPIARNDTLMGIQDQMLGS